MLAENEDKLHMMADALIEYETLLPEQIDDIMAGAKPRAPNPPKSGGTKQDSEPAGDETPIGGPAEEH